MASEDPSSDDVGIADWLGASSSDPQAVAQRYDSWATAYDEDLQAWDYRAPSTVVATLMSLRPDADPVLDVGCGTGMVARTLRAHGFAGRIRGLDISPASLALARTTGEYESLVAADLQQRLPVDDDSVDAALCVGVMTYLPEVEAIWRELARVVRPDGIVVVTQRDDLWRDRECRAVVDRLAAEGLWTPVEIAGPAAYLPDGYGGGDAVSCYYLSARVLS
ncbi:class I SAM-dependent methyltransferase [Nocardioides mangrovicus]|uniref:Class I SAM-dependent methyltransferase n=1 Tax=Nocardioides mangrovicus TaxID=2478913 RepID=A0A3L8NX69_9ACTN|nr:class I SAM-dependent methyltransferase [Nocardioides mangrovicus]RLV47534.1 class I SAM-dependent methyltransferase [Nocardioides mangrovicus]